MYYMCVHVCVSAAGAPAGMGFIGVRHAHELYALLACDGVDPLDLVVCPCHHAAAMCKEVVSDAWTLQDHVQHRGVCGACTSEGAPEVASLEGMSSTQRCGHR